MRDPVEQYEANAEAFYRETRFMAPGKDIPAAMGGYDEHELRVKLWRVWLEKQHMANRIRELEAQHAASEPVLVLDAARFALVSREVLAHMSIEGVDIAEEAIAIALGKGYEEPTDDDYTQAVRVAVDELRLRLESPSVTEVPRG